MEIVKNCQSKRPWSAQGWFNKKSSNFHFYHQKLNFYHQKFQSNFHKNPQQIPSTPTRGCKGGWSQEIYTYSNQHGGCASLRSCPYHARSEQSCAAANQRPRVPNSRCQGMLTTGTSESETLRAIERFGPVTAYFAVYRSFMSYHGGVYQRTHGDDKILGYHAVVFAGYGDENGHKYWLIRNSWGECGDVYLMTLN
jgi:hypothetical protein